MPHLGNANSSLIYMRPGHYSASGSKEGSSRKIHLPYHARFEQSICICICICYQFLHGSALHALMQVPQFFGDPSSLDHPSSVSSSFLTLFAVTHY